MTSFRPTKIEQLAIEAKLNLIFGAKVYDSLFLGFEVMEVAKDELRAWAPSRASGGSYRGSVFRHGRLDRSDGVQTTNPAGHGSITRNETRRLRAASLLAEQQPWVYSDFLKPVSACFRESGSQAKGDPVSQLSPHVTVPPPLWCRS
jgi:hypothetical protein